MEHHFILEAHSLADTAAFAAQLAGLVRENTVIALDGDLGAGKTTFSQQFAAALGVEEVVNSPTFSIIKEYEGVTYPFFHMDVYRLDEEQADQLGLDEYFYGGGVTLVEWASLIPSLLPSDYLQIRIERIAHEEVTELRRFIVIAHGEPYDSWCERLAQTKK